MTTPTSRLVSMISSDYNPCAVVGSGACTHRSTRNMNIGSLARSLVILLVTAITGVCEDVPEKPKDTFPKWAFCVAYQVRDPDDRDARPVNPSPNAVKDPLNNGDTWIPNGLINDRNIVDVAALTTRLVKSGALKHEAAEGVIRRTTAGTKMHPIMECYDPHHLFVFYGYDGHPVAAIEVCFSCNRVKMTPEIRVGSGAVGPFETADLAGLAKIATEAGLDLKPFASIDTYVKRLDQLTKRIQEQEANDTRQPDTRPELKLKGSDKHQFEAEGNSR